MIQVISNYITTLYEDVLSRGVFSVEVLDNSVASYGIAFVAFVASFIILKIIKATVVFKLKKLSEKTDTQLDDLVTRIISAFGFPFFILVSLIIGLQFISKPQIIDTIISYAILAVFLYYGVKALQQIIDYGFDNIGDRLGDIDASAVRLLSNVLKGSLWVIAALLLIQNLGYDITALIAGLGIGGLAVAFALKSIVSDIFASFSIYFDKPFKTGDYIVLGNNKGTVKHIGIKTTRIESTQGEELVIPNTQLTEAIVQNHGVITKRRVAFSFGVAYETPTKKLKSIPGIVKEIIEKQKLTEFDRTYFTDFGDFSLNFGVVFFYNSGDYAEFLSAQQEINFSLKERFEKEGIEFAYPTQTIFVKK